MFDFIRLQFHGPGVQGNPGLKRQLRRSNSDTIYLSVTILLQNQHIN